MTNLRTGAPATVFYRGDLGDTASLVGLAHSRINVGLIVFTGEMSDALTQYCKILNYWLRSKGLPRISIHPKLTPTQLEHIIDRPHQEWGWGKKECEAAIRLAGLQPPPLLSQIESLQL